MIITGEDDKYIITYQGDSNPFNIQAKPKTNLFLSLFKGLKLLFQAVLNVIPDFLF